MKQRSVLFTVAVRISRIFKPVHTPFQAGGDCRPIPATVEKSRAVRPRKYVPCVVQTGLIVVSNLLSKFTELAWLSVACWSYSRIGRISSDMPLFDQVFCPPS